MATATVMTIQLLNADTATNASSDTDTNMALSKLPDSQVFARDPEDYTTETTADTIARLSKILVRIRKARNDDAEIVALTAKAKAANKKKKSKSDKPLMEQTI